MWFSASQKKVVSSSKVFRVGDIYLKVVDTQVYLGLVFDNELHTVSWV